MALILLPDICVMPNLAGKRKRREGEGEISSGRESPAKRVGKSPSFFSESSGDSSRSRASFQSGASSRCSFPSVVFDEEEEEEEERNGGRVRIAIGGM